MNCQAIYSKGVYGQASYGDSYCLAGTPKYTFLKIPLGLWVRKQLANVVIFRVQPGNGFFNSKRGEVYQHRYPYFVPASITHANGDASRALLACAVTTWQSLTVGQKLPYNSEASRHERMSGYNLFIKEYMLSNYAP